MRSRPASVRRAYQRAKAAADLTDAERRDLGLKPTPGPHVSGHVGVAANGGWYARLAVDHLTFPLGVFACRSAAQEAVADGIAGYDAAEREKAVR